MPDYYNLIRDRLEKLLGIAPDEYLIKCLLNEIIANQCWLNLEEFMKLSDQDILDHYLAIQAFFSV